MTVAELISELSTFDPDLDVRFIGESDDIIRDARVEEFWMGEPAVYLSAYKIPNRRPVKWTVPIGSTETIQTDAAMRPAKNTRSGT